MTTNRRNRRPSKSATVHDLPLEFLRCRAFNHLWDEYVPVGKPKPSFGFRWSMLCVSCLTEKHEIIDSVGGVADRQYEYPDGYQLEAKTTKSEARLLYERKRPRSRMARRGRLVVEVKERAGR